jgi:hypothetical protein
MAKIAEVASNFPGNSRKSVIVNSSHSGKSELSGAQIMFPKPKVSGTE